MIIIFGVNHQYRYAEKMHIVHQAPHSSQPFAKETVFLCFIITDTMIRGCINDTISTNSCMNDYVAVFLSAIHKDIKMLLCTCNVVDVVVSKVITQMYCSSYYLRQGIMMNLHANEVILIPLLR